MDDNHWMSEALLEARKAAALGDVPVGAIIVKDDQVLGRGYNRREVDGDPLAHAELVALRQASNAVDGWRLIGCSLYVTLEPCAMCAGALVNSRIDALIYGARDPKAGYCGSLGNLAADDRLNHRLEIREGIRRDECSALLKSFFRNLRKARKREDPTARLFDNGL